jgi:hypothetical protein
MTTATGRSRPSPSLAVLVLALLLTCAIPSVAAASHSRSDGGPRDFAVGGGFTGSESGDPAGAQHVGFAAFGGPTTLAGIGGDPVGGHFRAGGEFVDPQGGGNELVEFEQEGPVTCLVVDGNEARLVYPIKQAKPEANELNEVLIVLQDNGKPQNGESVDRIAFAVIPDETPFDDSPEEQDTECVAPVTSPVMSTLTRGDFTVHDAR